MRFNKLDLNLLVALDALLTEQHISRAAEKTHLSQSAMSNALARLRDYFGDELLVQVGRHMELTARAELLKDPVRDILVRVKATVTQQPRFDHAHSDRLFRLLVSDYTAMTLIPHLQELVYAQAPQVRIELRQQVTQPHRVLERGDVDLLIIPQEFVASDHPQQVLFEETFCCVIWRHSQHAKRTLTRARYLAARHVCMQPNEGAALVDWHMDKLGIKRIIETSTFAFLSQAQLVVGTDRIATMHQRLAQMAQRFLPIELRPIPIKLPRMQQMMQWHRHHASDPALVWMRDMLHQAVAAMDR